MHTLLRPPVALLPVLSPPQDAPPKADGEPNQEVPEIKRKATIEDAAAMRRISRRSSGGMVMPMGPTVSFEDSPYRILIAMHSLVVDDGMDEEELYDHVTAGELWVRSVLAPLHVRNRNKMIEEMAKGWRVATGDVPKDLFAVAMRAAKSALGGGLQDDLMAHSTRDVSRRSLFLSVDYLQW